VVSKIQSLVASAFFALIAATGANAATVTYTNADESPVMQLTISNVENGVLFSIMTADEFGTADYLALAFNLDVVEDLIEDDFVPIAATDAGGNNIDPLPELTLYEDTRDCENGCNFNGDDKSLYDYIIKFAGQGGSGDNYVNSISFEITDLGDDFDLENFSMFSIRAQSTSNLEGSLKADLTISPVPLPAGLPLLLSGLLAAGWLARRRTV